MHVKSGDNEFSQFSMTTPREFLELVVHPNARDFHDRFDDLRLAHNAVSSIDALAAHIFYWAKTNRPEARVTSLRDDTEYRDSLATQSSQFRLLRDIAKAQKHVHLTRGTPIISRAEQISTRSLGYGEAKFGEGRYGGACEVVVDLSPDQVASVQTIVDDSIAFLERQMCTLGI